MVAPLDKHYTARVIDRKDYQRTCGWCGSIPEARSRSRPDNMRPRVWIRVRNTSARLLIVSSPYEEGTLEFFVELVPQGELTPHLYKLQKGDTLLCRKIAKGRFTLDLKSGRTNHFLLARLPALHHS